MNECLINTLSDHSTTELLAYISPNKKSSSKTKDSFNRIFDTPLLVCHEIYLHNLQENASLFSSCHKVLF